VVAESYDLPLERALADVTMLVEQMTAAGLLVLPQ
jgi:hypothetical protein